MGKKHYFIYKIICMVLLCLLFISLLVSLQSRILYLDNLSYKFIMCLFFIILLAFFILLIPKKTKSSYLEKFKLFYFRHSKIIFWLFYFFCVIYQIFLLMNLRSTPRYDSALLLDKLTSSETAAEYLSVNSNNLSLYFINHFLSMLIGKNVYNFQVANALFIFIAMLLFKRLVSKLFKNKNIGYLSTMILMFYSIIQPLYLVPYTDTYCLIPMFISVDMLISSYNYNNNFKVYFYSIGSAFFGGISYLIRPSCIVFIIAVFIFLIINFNKKSIRTFSLKFMPLYFLGLAITLIVFSVFVNSQKIIELDLSKKVPVTHFLLLGSFGNEDEKDALHGTWNAEDINTTSAGKDTKEKSKFALKAFVERTKKRGPYRTLKFYMQKYFQNTDSGVVGYHRDGLWLNSVYSPDDTFNNKVQQVYNEDGRLRPTFNFICQVFWIFTLYFSLVALYNNRNWTVALIALTIFGGLLFLEIFESGGTKYLYQYMPWISILSGVGIYFKMSPSKES